jgi:hypothetical protein
MYDILDERCLGGAILATLRLNNSSMKSFLDKGGHSAEYERFSSPARALWRNCSSSHAD